MKARKKTIQPESLEDYMAIRVRVEPPPRTVDAHKRRVKAVTSCGPQPTRGKKRNITHL
jgi:hypothetical protein